MGLQHCYMISIWWTDWKSLIEVWLQYLLRMCTRRKSVFSKTRKREKKTKKQKQTSIAFMTSFYRLKGYKEEGGRGGGELTFYMHHVKGPLSMLRPGSKIWEKGTFTFGFNVLIGNVALAICSMRSSYSKICERYMLYMSIISIGFNQFSLHFHFFIYFIFLFLYLFIAFINWCNTLYVFKMHIRNHTKCDNLSQFYKTYISGITASSKKIRSGCLEMHTNTRDVVRMFGINIFKKMLQ